jgi:uncharacterized membrane protein YccF (DUF307 family)
MRSVLNIIWLVLAGFWQALGYLIGGLLMAITIIGIPFAVQAFKLAGFSVWPFGRVVVPKSGSGAGSAIGNILWVVLAGWWLALSHFVSGLLLMLTVIGIPMGVACFKLARLALAPFGKSIVDRQTLGSLPPGSVAV